MRAGSLVILGAVFLSAFAGRAAVLAARASEGEAPTPSRDVCVNGTFADELLEQAARLQAAKAAQAETDRTRAVVLQHVNERIDAYEKAGDAFTAVAMKVADDDRASAKKIAALYEKMKPDLAGGIVGGMDPAFAASLLLSMNGENASAILGALPPEKAYAITVLMADAS